MKIMITGGKGMLGCSLQKKINNHNLIIADIDTVDITNSFQTEVFIKDNKPDVVIHCAAMTNVDACETEIDKAYMVNAVGSSNIASSTHKVGAKLIAISTDYVFDGNNDKPYNEYDKPNPTTIYGKSKFAGEEAIRTHCPNHVIIRTAWLYGFGGPSFVHTMIKLADGSKDEIKVVNDQIGNPTSTNALSDMIMNFINHETICGTFHVTCEGETSWYGFAKKIFSIKGINQKVIPCATDEFPRPAKRPKNSSLDKMNLRLHSFLKMPNWEYCLEEFLKEEKF